MQLILAIRKKSRENKDWGTSDKIRDALQKLNITVKDTKEGSIWNQSNNRVSEFISKPI